MQYAHLSIYVEPSIRPQYEEHVKNHNSKVMSSSHPDSGFDLFVLKDETIKDLCVKRVSMGVKCSMTMNNVVTGFYLYPRSSISKTNLMMANHVGIIDSGYRGWIMGAFRYLAPQDSIIDETYMRDQETTIQKGTRLTQICHPSLCPILVNIVDSEEDLVKTDRGEGGFGSTGK